MKSERDKDPYYQVLRTRYLEARSLIGDLQKAQALDRILLNSFYSGDINERKIRHQLAQRRLGPNGLRALNNAIKHFYNYCDQKGY